jgi:hypothetical protein
MKGSVRTNEVEQFNEATIIDLGFRDIYGTQQQLQFSTLMTSI